MGTKVSDEEESIPTVLFHVELSDSSVPEITIDLELPFIWHIYRAIHLGGFEEIRLVLIFGGVIMKTLDEHNVADPEKSFDEAWYQFGDVFDLPKREWKTESDLALSFCYYLLRQELINRTGAAELGRNLLEHHDRAVTPAEVEAFRKRVDRWAERHSLPRPGQTRRRTIAA